MKKTKIHARKPRPARQKSKPASRKPVALARGSAREEIDGCDVAVTNATLDHDLPASKGGMA